MLTFDSNTARQADQINSSISEAGKYVGTITRAEKLLSGQGTQGLGLSFKTDAGETADYLDIYTVNAAGVVLPSMKIAQAILGCLQLRQASEGKVKVTKWNKLEKKREEVVVDGYPEIMNKRIGLLLQKELSTHSQTGATTEKMIIAGVFQHDTELTVSEILNKKTTPETLGKMVQWLQAHPVRDARKPGSAPVQNNQQSSAPVGNGFADFDDIPF